MSKKHQRSELPTDFSFTPSTGSNFGLDGFQFDEPYGEGTKDRARLPSSRGLSQLPEDLVGQSGRSQLPGDESFRKTEDERMDLSEVVEKSGSLVDLSWISLDPSSDRLPVDPSDKSMQELETLWNRNRYQDVDPFIPNKERHAADQNVRRVNLNPHEPLRLAQSLLRRQTQEREIPAITDDVYAKLGDQAEPLLQRMQEDEHLIGNVFIRASAFPQCEQGEWTDFVRRYANNAQYAIKKEACSDCIHAQNGNCRIFHKTLVGRVPWKKALRGYQKSLVASGRLVEGDSAKETLRESFATLPSNRSTYIETDKPVIRHDVASNREARKDIERALNTPLPSPDSRVVVQDRKHRIKVQHQISTWVRKGFLNEEQHMRLKLSCAAPQDVLQTALVWVSHSQNLPKTSTYEGSGHRLVKKASVVTSEEALRSLEAAEEASRKRQEALSELFQERCASYLLSLKRRGLLVEKDYQQVLAELERTKDPEKAIRFASSLIEERSGSPVEIPRFTEKVRRYEGVGKDATEFVPYRVSEPIQATRDALQVRDIQKRDAALNLLVDKDLITPRQRDVILEQDVSYAESMKLASHCRANRDSSRSETPRTKKARAYQGTGVGKRLEAGTPRNMKKVSAKEITSFLRWVSGQMNEGLAGDILSETLQVRFSQELRDDHAVQRALEMLRDRHEGLAGHLYVDAQVYASKRGAEGCDRGGQRHRTNQIPYVLGMDRCDTCVFHNQEGFCQKYKKEIIFDLPSGSEDFQRRMIREANSKDHEVTSSLFQDPSTSIVEEFDLRDPLEHISLHSTPDVDTLGEFLFGDYHIGE